MILLDTDVLIDIALDRQPHSPAAVRLLDSIEQGDERACIAWHTVSNFYYLVAPSLGRESVKTFIVELTRFVDVASADAHAVRYAASLAMTDFEDALQVAAARSAGARRIVTRNTKDYARSPIPAVLPETAIEFLTTKQGAANIEEASRLLRRNGGQPPEPRDSLDIENDEDPTS